jgi:hypothetical protein
MMWELLLLLLLLLPLVVGFFFWGFPWSLRFPIEKLMVLGSFEKKNIYGLFFP